MKTYDYIVVGSGLFGCVFAREMKRRGKRLLVLERRGEIGGNIYTERVEGIDIHRYGPHIFHTNRREIWDYVDELAPLRPVQFSPVANFRGEIYNLPFNMNTFYRLWGVRTPEEAAVKLADERAAYADIEPRNLEEQALKLVGRDIYEKLVKGYTEKQWGRDAKELPAFIIKRLPLRFTFDNNYFNDRYQGIPIGGYTSIIEKLLYGIEVRLDTDYKSFYKEYGSVASKIIYTGMIDEYYDYKLGVLEYRSLKFETEELHTENYQGNAVVNYTKEDIPYTRIIEHKHFEHVHTDTTIVSKEYPCEWKIGDEAYYPINDDKNIKLYEAYRELADKEENLIFGGRLGEYKYYDMDKVILAALELVEKEL